VRPQPDCSYTDNPKELCVLTWPPRFLKLKTMNILTVLEFEDGLVYQYDVRQAFDMKELQAEDFEKIIIEQGHRLDDCEWMSHSDDTINKIKIEL
jgi:hypothetical protein